MLAMMERPVAPLDGLRILDLSTYVAGPSSAMTLGQLGAEVIRIDPLGGATDTHRFPLDQHGSSLYWISLNKTKKSLEINIRSTEGQDLVRRLLVESGPEGGIVVTNAAGQGWLSYESLSEHRPDLIMIHIDGRPDGTPAVDYTVNCEVGLPLITGPASLDGPVNHVLPAWDLLTGQQAALGILAAERVRARTGHGQLVRIALSDVAVTTIAHLGFVADVTVNEHRRVREGNYLYGSFGADFQTADGARVMVVALTGRHWRNLVDATGTQAPIHALENSLSIDLREEGTRYSHKEIIAALFAPWFASRTLRDVSAELETHHVLWGPYRTIEQLVRDPDSPLNLSDRFTPLDHPGIGTIPTPRTALRFDDAVSPTPDATPGPAVGADTDYVLGTLLDLSPAHLADLRARRIIGG
jgi:2-methylfumaryl-CoA isomerase